MRTIYYQLPSGIALSEEETGSVMNEQTGVVIGTYTISTDGLVQIEFTQAFAQGGQSVTGRLQFQGQVSATGQEGDDTIDLGFGGSSVTVVERSRRQT